MLKTALDWYIARYPPDVDDLLFARERWGRFALSQGDVAGAQEQFREVLSQAHGRKLAPIALAHAGIARVELTRGHVDAALAASKQAVEMFGNVTGLYDVRTGPLIWLIHSEALRRAGENAKALEWAQRALNASRQYDDPAAASIAAAQAAVRAAQSAPSAR
jgi:serine/threonine-protein kinase